ncbi:MAG: gliding motility-associated C-terminal domain-containing protein, partial [Bacteroidota bacterium]
DQYIIVFGDTIQTAGIYCESFIGSNGCDSTHCIQVNVADTIRTEEAYYLCEGESMMIFGQEINYSGVFSQNFNNVAGCDSIHQIQLEILPPIDTDTIIEVCEGQTFTVDGMPYSEPGAYQFFFERSSVYGCDSFHTTQLIIHPGPVIEIEPAGPIEIWINQSVELSVLEDPTYTYQWTPPNELSCDDCPNPLAYPSADSYYEVLVTDERGCTATDDIEFVVKDACIYADIKVPNAFTPNNDGVNDGFWIYEQEGLDRLIYLRVWNRWGEMVFETDQLDEKWDGTYKGEALNPGVYAYLIKAYCIGGQLMTTKGNVTILK